MATSTVSAGPKRPGSEASTIALKTLSAVTGVFFVLFIALHMYGNLMIFGGEDAFNNYAHHLRELGEPMLPYGGALWITRVLLILALVGHAYAAFALWKRAGSARSTKYVVKRPTSYGSFYAKAMRWGGIALLLFVPFHILHFTTSTIEIGGQDFSGPAEHLVASFGVWWAVLIYTLAIVALGLHLYHGVWGASMTLGLNTSAKAASRIRAVATILSLVIVVGYLTPPYLILTGVIP